MKNTSVLFLVLFALKCLESAPLTVMPVSTNPSSSSSSHDSGNLFESEDSMDEGSRGNRVFVDESSSVADEGELFETSTNDITSSEVKSSGVKAEEFKASSEVKESEDKVIQKTASQQESSMPVVKNQRPEDLLDNAPFADDFLKTAYRNHAPPVRTLRTGNTGDASFSVPERKSLLKSSMSGDGRASMAVRKSVSIAGATGQSRPLPGCQVQRQRPPMGPDNLMAKMPNRMTMSSMPSSRMTSMPNSRMTSASPSSRVSSYAASPRISTASIASASPRKTKPSSFYDEMASSSLRNLQGIHLGFCDTATMGAIANIRMIGLKFPRQANSMERQRIAQYVAAIIDTFPCDREKQIMKQAATDMPPIYSDRAKFNKWATLFGKRVLKDTKSPIGLSMNNLLLPNRRQ